MWSTKAEMFGFCWKCVCLPTSVCTSKLVCTYVARLLWYGGGGEGWIIDWRKDRVSRKWGEEAEDTVFLGVHGLLFSPFWHSVFIKIKYGLAYSICAFSLFCILICWADSSIAFLWPFLGHLFWSLVKMQPRIAAFFTAVSFPLRSSDNSAV